MALTLKQARNLRGLSLADVAKLVGKTPQTISYWEQGQSRISAEDFLKLCQIYGMGPNNIFLPEKSS